MQELCKQFLHNNFLNPFCYFIFFFLVLTLLIPFSLAVAPIVTIHSPENQKYYFEGNITLNAASDQTINASWYNLNGTNITFTSPIDLTLEEDNYNLTIYINNSDGEIGQDSAYFFVVKEEWSYYYLYLIVFVIIFFLLILGYKTEDWYFVIFSGMLFCIVALTLFLEGFPNFTNTFILNMSSIVFAGIGLYLIVISSYNMIRGGAEK